jgi:hypothetical protein
MVKDPEPAMESMTILYARAATIEEGEEAAVKSCGAVQWPDWGLPITGCAPC